MNAANHSPPSRVRLSRKRKLAYTAAVLIAFLVLVEAALRAQAWVSRSLARRAPASEPVEFADERLGVRPNPRFPEHDARGFRNPRVPDRADIVALGDSQTYGVNVSPAQAWPSRLAHRARLTGYNMAYAGWGPAHGLLLLDEAIALRPRVILEAVYSGNDLYDCYSLIHIRKQLGELLPPDAEIRKKIAAAEAEGSIPSKIRALRPRPVPENARRGRSLVAILSRYSMIFRMPRKALGLPAKEVSPRKKKGKDPLTFRHEAFRTEFTPLYRFYALDTDDPRIQDGRRILLESLREMQARARASGIAFMVVFIPTKEFVFREVVAESGGSPSEIYPRLIEMERETWQVTREFLDRQGIAYVDAEPALRDCLRRGRQPYPETDDGHPNVLGHEAIAQGVFEELERREFLPAADQGKLR